MANNKHSNNMPFLPILPSYSKEAIRLVMNNMSIFQKIVFKIQGFVQLNIDNLSDDLRDRMPLYIFYCEKHGFQITSPSGYDGVLVCEECLNERLHVNPLLESNKKRILHPYLYSIIILYTLFSLSFECYNDSRYSCVTIRGKKDSRVDT